VFRKFGATRRVDRTSPTQRHPTGADAGGSRSHAAATTRDSIMIKKTQPLPLIGPKRCPVCGHSAYSAAGIHPQCAVKRVDNELKNTQSRIDGAIPKRKTTPWSKPRPK
jgi:hypothetical protein